MYSYGITIQRLENRYHSAGDKAILAAAESLLKDEDYRIADAGIQVEIHPASGPAITGVLTGVDKDAGAIVIDGSEYPIDGIYHFTA
ncbi:hypothetical protein [Gordonia sihwensis]|uniref:hypothetical protein n=1 Tax=Gordonia sihwensis TaxID=173559 RepID=UPI003D983DB5